MRGRPAGLVASVTESESRAWAAVGFALFEGRGAVNGQPTAYLCRDFTCRLPVTDPAQLMAAGPASTHDQAGEESTE